MVDLIKREDAIKAVSEPFDRKYWQYTTRSIRDTVKALKDIPSAEHLIYEEMEKADIEAQAYAKGFKEGLEARKQGEWISLHNGKWKCSECGIEVLIYAKGNFCPNCGARMK